MSVSSVTSTKPFLGTLLQQNKDGVKGILRDSNRHNFYEDAEGQLSPGLNK